MSEPTSPIKYKPTYAKASSGAMRGDGTRDQNKAARLLLAHNCVWLRKIIQEIEISANDTPQTLNSPRRDVLNHGPYPIHEVVNRHNRTNARRTRQTAIPPNFYRLLLEKGRSRHLLRGKRFLCAIFYLEKYHMSPRNAMRSRSEKQGTIHLQTVKRILPWL